MPHHAGQVPDGDPPAILHLQVRLVNTAFLCASLRSQSNSAQHRNVQIWVQALLQRCAAHSTEDRKQACTQNHAFEITWERIYASC